MKVLLAFVLVVTVGAMWETRRERAPKAAPLLVLCVAVAALLYGVSRLV